jgi:hypothetical protein
VLRPGAIAVKEGAAKANVFETPGHYVVFVGLAGQEKSAKIELRGIHGAASLLHPGGTSEVTIAAMEQPQSTVFDVPLKRGCAMLRLEKKSG